MRPFETPGSSCRVQWQRGRVFRWAKARLGEAGFFRLRPTNPLIPQWTLANFKAFPLLTYLWISSSRHGSPVLGLITCRTSAGEAQRGHLGLSSCKQSDNAQHLNSLILQVLWLRLFTESFSKTCETLSCMYLSQNSKWLTVVSFNNFLKDLNRFLLKPRC